MSYGDRLIDVAFVLLAVGLIISIVEKYTSTPPLKPEAINIPVNGDENDESE